MALRVLPDSSADPVWAEDAMVDLDDLQVSDRLRRELRAWARRWEELMGPAFECTDAAGYAEWRRRGRPLAGALQAELGGAVEVVYDPGVYERRSAGPARQTRLR